MLNYTSIGTSLFLSSSNGITLNKEQTSHLRTLSDQSAHSQHVNRPLSALHIHPVKNGPQSPAQIVNPQK